MPRPTLSSRTATIFSRSGEIDEPAFRLFLQRLVDARAGVCLGSGGSGEGHALTWDELRRVYEIGVETCKGKVALSANPPEQHTAARAIAHAQHAIAAGIDLINLYPPAGWHGFRATDDELLAFFEHVLGSIRHPVALTISPSMGYVPKAALIAGLCHRYGQIVEVNLPSGLAGNYLAEFKDALQRNDVAIGVMLTGSMNAFTLGASSITAPEANILPRTHRLYLDLYEAGRLEEMGDVYAGLNRFSRFVSRWAPHNARWIKMAMKVLKLPGGEGGLREPYRMPGAADLRTFTEGLLGLGVPELDDLARAAGLR